MSQWLGQLDIVGNQNDTFDAPNNGVQAILVGNESGLTVIVTMIGGGVEKTLYPSTVDWFAVKKGFSGKIAVRPMAVLSNFSSFPSSVLFFDAIGMNDDDRAANYPLTLAGRVANIGNAVPVSTSTNAIANDGNAAGASLVEATVLGDGASAVTWSNDAHLVNGDAAHPGTVSFDNHLITSDGAGHMTVVSLQQDEVDALRINNPAGTLQMQAAGVNCFQATAAGLNLNANKNIQWNVGSITRLHRFAGTGSGVFAHGLGVTPDIILCNPCLDNFSSQTIGFGNRDATNVTVTAGAGLSWEALAIKF